METATKVNITISVDAHEFVSAVLGSSFTTWSWWTEFKFVDGYDWDTTPSNHNLKFVKVGIQDPESYDIDDDVKTKRKSLSVNDIAKAFGELVSKGYTLDHADLDAIGADSVMQYAVLGEVTYG